MVYYKIQDMLLWFIKHKIIIGCGIAYKNEKFDMMDYNTVDYTTDNTSSPSFMTGNIAQMIALQFKANPEVGFIVGNTHLYWKPCASYERFRQITIYKKRFMEFKSRLMMNYNQRWISVLLGGNDYAQV